MLSTEELLKPRYIVENDYPESQFSVGYIIQFHHIYPYSGYSSNLSNGFTVAPGWFDKYPHLFRKLDWWEHREIVDLPEYVKCISTPDQNIMPDEVLKIKWNEVFGRDEKGRIIIVNTNCYIPATEQQYLEYINKPK